MSEVTRLGRARANKIRLEKDTNYFFPDEDTDYLFCPACRVHVPCRRLEAGGWEVQCPGCVGECIGCMCHLKQFCFGSRQEFPPFERPAGHDKD